jgi:hypothetical protein
MFSAQGWIFEGVNSGEQLIVIVLTIIVGTTYRESEVVTAKCGVKSVLAWDWVMGKGELARETEDEAWLSDDELSRQGRFLKCLRRILFPVLKGGKHMLIYFFSVSIRAILLDEVHQSPNGIIIIIRARVGRVVPWVVGVGVHVVGRESIVD